METMNYQLSTMNYKVAFFYENSGRVGFNFTTIAQGNPGIGGGAYMFYLVAWLLATRHNGISVTLLNTHKGQFPPELKVAEVNDMEDAARYCQENGIEHLVVKHSDSNLQHRELFNSTQGPKLIVWCHNFANGRQLSFYAKSRAVERLICVGSEQMDRYRDHEAFAKSDYIFNCVVAPTRQQHQAVQENNAYANNSVVYIGAVIPSKGLHLLTAAWPKVKAAVPDAHLYIIGSGALYGGNPQLGPWNLAEPAYEMRVLNPILVNGKLMEGVHLLGVLGKEKYDVLSQMRVGVPNPSGETETFCISAVEMQLMGARIVSKQCPGYLDTVRNGVLVKKNSDLADAIIQELKAPRNKKETSLAHNHEGGLFHDFSTSSVAHDWEQLITHAIPEGRHLHPILPLRNPRFESKWLKERLRQCKQHLPWLYRVLPMVDRWYELRRAIERRRS